CVDAGRFLAYPVAEEELITWIKELYLVRIAATARAIKIQMTTILATTCANTYS
ncbi:4166_t:CDS:1, partial [Ambispora leptoticha]